MLRPGNDNQVYLHAEAVDMRKSIHGLSALVERDMALPNSSEVLFVFCNRARDKIKMLSWERNGFVVWYKRLEKQRINGLIGRLHSDAILWVPRLQPVPVPLVW